MNLGRLYRYFKPVSEVRKQGQYMCFYAVPIEDLCPVYIAVPEEAFLDHKKQIVLKHIFTFTARNGREYVAFRFVPLGPDPSQEQSREDFTDSGDLPF